jgi:hypothetical protein
MAKSGKYQLSAPGLTSDERKNSTNYTEVDTIEEAVELIRNHGYYARMKNVEQPNQAPDIIMNTQIHVFETNC